MIFATHSKLTKNTDVVFSDPLLGHPFERETMWPSVQQCYAPKSFLQTTPTSAIVNLPGYCCNLGHRDALQTRRDRDADTIKTPAQGVGSILATTRGQTGKGRDVPEADTTRPQLSGLG